jgi:hypothetical protein
MDAVKIGQRCESLWREAWGQNERRALSQPRDAKGFHRIAVKRPQARKRILLQVAAEFQETPRMVERLWDDYREFEKDLKADDF